MSSARKRHLAKSDLRLGKGSLRSMIARWSRGSDVCANGFAREIVERYIQYVKLTSFNANEARAKFQEIEQRLKQKKLSQGAFLLTALNLTKYFSVPSESGCTAWIRGIFYNFASYEFYKYVRDHFTTLTDQDVDDIYCASLQAAGRLTAGWRFREVDEWSRRILHQNLIPPEPRKKKDGKECRVYFILGMETNKIKIGSSIDPEQRRKTLQTGSAELLRLIGAIPGTARHERALQKQFAAHNVHDEWFKPAPVILSYMTSVGVVLPDNLKQLASAA